MMSADLDAIDVVSHFKSALRMIAGPFLRFTWSAISFIDSSNQFIDSFSLQKHCFFA